VGGDSPGKTELARGILLRSDIFVEFPPQTRIEGEIQQLPADFPVTELWEVVTGRRPGRASADELTLWDSVGFAVEDWSVLRHVRDDVTAKEPGLLQHLDLVAEPEDPKDLYALVRGARTTAPAHQGARVPVADPA
jgi:ornithine cyclodeaminase